MRILDQNDYMNMYFLYMLMSMENYASYKKANSECEQMEKKGIDYRVDSKSNQTLRADYFAKLLRRSSCIFGSIIYEALAVEAFINCYASNKLGNSFFEDHLDKLTIVNKYVVITKLTTGKDFPKDNNVYERLQLLIATRNSLVHSKSINIASLEGEQLNQQIDRLRKVKGKSLVEIMSITQGLCEELSELLNSLNT